MPLPHSLLATTSLIPASHSPLKTLYPSLDKALCGGLPAAGLIEVFGPAASGKTALILMLAVSAALEGNTAVLIDCCGSVTASRIAQILHANGGNASHLSQIFVCRVTSWNVLVGCVAHIIPTARYVGVDGVSFLFRSSMDGAALKRLELFAMRLQQKAASCGGIVAFANDIRMGAMGEVQTAMGETWRHVCATRISLGWQHRIRVAEVVKSAIVGRVRVEFEISESGFTEECTEEDE